MELSSNTGVDVNHHTLSSSYIYMRMLYMFHILYDIYICVCVTLSPPFFSVFSPPFFRPNQNAFSWPSLLHSWTEGATMRPMLGMLFFQDWLQYVSKVTEGLLFFYFFIIMFFILFRFWLGYGSMNGCIPAMLMSDMLVSHLSGICHLSFWQTFSNALK